MGLIDIIRGLPKPLKRLVYAVYSLFGDKYRAEMAFWESRYRKDNGEFRNNHYQKIMMGIAEESDVSFFDGKVIADFGCGPRGTMTWIKGAALRVGVDVLMDRYLDSFFDCMVKHDTVYVKSTEKVIPLPTDFVDILITINAIDHVDDFDAMCNEVVRVLKPGGIFLGSFNLNEPSAPCEPQQLNEERIKRCLLDQLTIKSYRASGIPEDGDRYRPFYEGDLVESKAGEEGTLWVRAEG
ncbi:MAG: methyltransferase domain-containing protein [Kiritimatiellae bacterium]|nr:methyltransferase domain-containing protein [Kiritimatiellia bacterium]